MEGHEVFKLFDLEGSNWINKSSLENQSFENLDQVFEYINSNLPITSKFATVEELHPKIFPTDTLLAIFNYVRQTALQLDKYFPSGEIKRLNSISPAINFTRRQVTVLLSHMLLCTLKKSPQNPYWVTFEIWLTDGRPCAIAYLRCLFGYFEQVMTIDEDPSWTEFWSETVTFQRNEIDHESIITRIQDSTDGLLFPVIHSDGKIGDTSTIEIDFANKDIGFGSYGTQEEIVFGSSPELCIAMLFCDTMQDNVCILIKGARKVGRFKGYGSKLEFEGLHPLDDVNRKDRIVIAMDATDYSEYDNPLETQLTRQHLEREMCKLVCGFSALPEGYIVDTGNWGCGAFCGQKYLKVMLQIIASSLSKVKLSFYTFGDVEQAEELGIFFRRFDNITIGAFWQGVINIPANLTAQSYKDSDLQIRFDNLCL